MTHPKLLIIGHGRHGKDTAAEHWYNKFQMNYKSSSLAAAEIFIFDELRAKYNYNTFEECYNDRHNHRAEWYNLIVDYNKNDKCRLAKDIMKTTTCYVGMRDRDEIIACVDNKIFDLVIWVDASRRLPPEPSDSFNIDVDLADFRIDNNNTLFEFISKLDRIGQNIFK